MSRIGKKPVPVPAGVKVQIADHTITVEGKLGKLQWEFRPEVSVAYDERAKMITVTPARRRTAEPRAARPDPRTDRQHDRRRDAGLRKTLGNPGRRLSCRRAGQDAAASRRLGQRTAGADPRGGKVSVPDQQHVVIQGIEKQKVGHFAASVRALRKPEPYKGKGIRYLGEAGSPQAGQGNGEIAM